jgi:hypothetical protein
MGSRDSCSRGSIRVGITTAVGWPRPTAQHDLALGTPLNSNLMGSRYLPVIIIVIIIIIIIITTIITYYYYYYYLLLLLLLLLSLLLLLLFPCVCMRMIPGSTGGRFQEL